MSASKRSMGAAAFGALVAFLLVAAAPLEAQAQYVDRDDNVRFEDEFDRSEFMVTPRIRAIVVPDFILGAWFDEHASHWDEGSNLAYGFDFVWRKVGDFEISTALEYADLSMPSAFWQESGDQPSDAEFTEVDMQLLSLVFSAYWYWDVEEWFAPYVGGGIGGGVVLGDIVRYEPRQGSTCRGGLGGSTSFAPNSCFNDSGGPDPSQIDVDNPDVEEDIPPVVPMVNLTGGLRFNMGEHGVAKLEVGFYDYFFAGASLGAQW